MLDEKSTGKPVRLSAMKARINGHHGISHSIVYVGGGKPDGEWSCYMEKPYPKSDDEKPFRQMIDRWNAAQKQER